VISGPSGWNCGIRSRSSSRRAGAGEVAVPHSKCMARRSAIRCGSHLVHGAMKADRGETVRCNMRAKYRRATAIATPPACVPARDSRQGARAKGSVWCRTAPSAAISFGVGAWSNVAWPFGLERFTAVPTGIGGCSSAILIAVGYSSGTSLIFPQVAKSSILRSEPFSSRPATDQRSKNSCA